MTRRAFVAVAAAAIIAVLTGDDDGGQRRRHLAATPARTTSTQSRRSGRKKHQNMKTVYAEATIYYTDPAGVARIRWMKGPYRTNARSTETARPAYAKHIYRSTCAGIRESITHASFCLIDPCDPCDRWILESDGSEHTARILAQCDAENIAAGREIPRASFLPPASI